MNRHLSRLAEWVHQHVTLPLRRYRKRQRIKYIAELSRLIGRPVSEEEVYGNEL